MEPPRPTPWLIHFLDYFVGSWYGGSPQNGSRGTSLPLHGPLMKSRSIANSAPDRSVILSNTPPDKLAKNQSWPDVPVSTSAAPSSHTVAVFSLTALSW